MDHAGLELGLGQRLCIQVEQGTDGGNPEQLIASPYLHDAISIERLTHPA